VQTQLPGKKAAPTPSVPLISSFAETATTRIAVFSQPQDSASFFTFSAPIPLSHRRVIPSAAVSRNMHRALRAISLSQSELL